MKDRAKRKTHLVECMAAFWHDMRFLSWEPKAEAQGLEADGTVVLLLWGVVAGDDGQRCGDHGCVGVGGGEGGGSVRGRGRMAVVFGGVGGGRVGRVQRRRGGCARRETLED